MRPDTQSVTASVSSTTSDRLADVEHRDVALADRDHAARRARRAISGSDAEEVEQHAGPRSVNAIARSDVASQDARGKSRAARRRGAGSAPARPPAAARGRGRTAAGSAGRAPCATTSSSSVTSGKISRLTPPAPTRITSWVRSVRRRSRRSANQPSAKQASTRASSIQPGGAAQRGFDAREIDGGEHGRGVYSIVCVRPAGSRAAIGRRGTSAAPWPAGAGSCRGRPAPRPGCRERSRRSRRCGAARRR